MLCADSMPRPHDAALQERESVLDRISVNVAHDVHLAAVLDSLMLAGLDACPLHCEWVAGKIVGHDYVHILADILPDVPGERSRLHIAGMDHPQFAVSLAA